MENQNKHSIKLFHFVRGLGGESGGGGGGGLVRCAVTLLWPLLTRERLYIVQYFNNGI